MKSERGLVENVERILANRTFPDAKQCEEGARAIIEEMAEAMEGEARRDEGFVEGWLEDAADWLRAQAQESEE